MRVRIAAVQYHLRHIRDWEGFESQVGFVLDAAAEYRPQFVLLPEIFTTQLMSLLDASDVRRAVRELSAFTPRYLDLMRAHAEKHGYHLVAGSHPTLRGDRLYNTAYLFNPAGQVLEQDKLHRTRWEKDHWDTTPGDALSLFETAHGKVAILVCYDVEFPELARQVCEAGADILFVPSCTDDRQGYLRVRYCCHARAIENQMYVVMAGVCGNLPNVENMDIHYAESAILTPCDIPFARDGVAADTAANTETIAVADLNLTDLEVARREGSVRNFLDRRFDLYRVAWSGEPAHHRRADTGKTGGQPGPPKGG